MKPCSTTPCTPLPLILPFPSPKNWFLKQSNSPHLELEIPIQIQIQEYFQYSSDKFASNVFITQKFSAEGTIQLNPYFFAVFFLYMLFLGSAYFFSS